MLQSITLDASFVTDAGATLDRPTVTYGAWGRLNDGADNAVVVCHALTGSPDATDWWGPLIGPGCALDTDRYFVVCLSAPGSPYGALSPRATDPATGRDYGSTFPRFTVRDSVRLHRAALDALGVRGVALAIGGSLGGMFALEWGRYPGFVRAVAPVAVGVRHEAWAIGWNEAQRQALFADAAWAGGDYDPATPPRAGLAAARAVAMLSYRSPAAFAERHGRRAMPDDPGLFAAASYLRYQGAKLADRFDAACYVALTHTLDSHDATRSEGDGGLADITVPALVVGIDSDVLYPLAEQEALAAALPDATLGVVRSPYGHDAFLIEFDQLGTLLRPWVERHAASPSTEALTS
ncbi:MAG: homoserine O-acetyltransferase [Bacteroidota bacterium]